MPPAKKRKPTPRPSLGCTLAYKLTMTPEMHEAVREESHRSGVPIAVLLRFAVRDYLKARAEKED